MICIVIEVSGRPVEESEAASSVIEYWQSRFVAKGFCQALAETNLREYLIPCNAIRMYDMGVFSDALAAFKNSAPSFDGLRGVYLRGLPEQTEQALLPSQCA